MASSAACWNTGEIEWPMGCPIMPIRCGNCFITPGRSPKNFSAIPVIPAKAGTQDCRNAIPGVAFRGGLTYSGEAQKPQNNLLPRLAGGELQRLPDLLDCTRMVVIMPTLFIR